MSRGRKPLGWYARPKVILSWTVPAAFVGIILGKSFNEDAQIDATIAGGLVAILASIVAGIFQPRKQEDENE